MSDTPRRPERGTNLAAGDPTFNLDAETLRGSGLLWKINHDLLHPLGLALEVSPIRPVADVPAGVVLRVWVAVDGEWEFRPAEMDTEGAARFAAWYAEDVEPLMVDRP